MRRHVPFGSHWAMGIEVPYSLGVFDGGAFWSCGQCPLDLAAAVQSPGDLESQLHTVASLIRAQFAPHGLPPASLAKLVAFVAGDDHEVATAQRLLKDLLAPVPLVTAVGVPPFYYEGMRVEVDVYGAEDSPHVLPGGGVQSGDLVHIAGSPEEIEYAMAAAGVSADHLLSARFYVAEGASVTLPMAVTWDEGSAVKAVLPPGQTVLADLVFTTGTASTEPATILEAPGQVMLTRRKAGRYLSLLGRSLQDGQTLAVAARAIMEAFAAELARDGLDFTHVVKQQTHYIGGANAEDLYANMVIRNGYYRKPGPASTGLAVAGIAGGPSLITIEILACRD